MGNGFSYLGSAELTDVGRVRKNNEDSVLRLPDAGVFCVADGMGGAQGGELASKAAVTALREAFTESQDAPYAVTAQAAACLVMRALNRASQWIKARAVERRMTGMGSTAVVLVFDRVMPSQALVLHAGDSRAYRYRADRLEQLSADHSVANAAGLRSDKMLPAIFRGVITRAVGLEETVMLEATPTDVAAGDQFLLCSDGLTKMLSDRQIQKLLRKHRADSLEALARTLVDETLKAGGEDNVSVVLVNVSAGLPKGPTQEISERTRLLENPPPPPDAQRAAAAADDPDADTGENEPPATSDTGKTEDPALERSQAVGRTPVSDDLIPGAGQTITPASGEGVTPTDFDSADKRSGVPDPNEEWREVLRSCVWGVNITLMVLYVISLVAWLVFRGKVG